MDTPGGTSARVLVIVKSGWPLGLRLPAYRSFVRRGLTVAVVETLVHQSLRFADVPIVCDRIDADAVGPRVLERAAAIDGVLTFNESGLVCAAELAEAHGLPFLPVATARAAIDKRQQRDAFARAGLLQPDWLPLTGGDDAAGAIRRWGRAIVKPVDRAASAAVSLVSTPDAARRAFELAREESHSGGVLAEQVIEGPEVSVESLAVDGRQRAICVTDKVMSDTFVELGHTLPSGLPDAVRSQAVDAALAGCDALGLGWGAAHTEVKLSPDGPVVIEVNPRIAGDCIPDLMRLALGVDVYDLAAGQALDQPTAAHAIERPARQAAAIAFRESVDGVFHGARSPLLDDPPDWLDELTVMAEPGMPLPPRTSNAARLAYAVAVGPDAREAARRARLAVDGLDVEIDSPGSGDVSSAA